MGNLKGNSVMSEYCCFKGINLPVCFIILLVYAESQLFRSYTYFIAERIETTRFIYNIRIIREMDEGEGG